MATSDELKRKVKVVMFDQYGTVVDMQGGLTEFVTPFLERWYPVHPAPAAIHAVDTE